MKRHAILIAAILWLGAAGAAVAQTVPPPPDPLKLTISRAHLQVIGQGLMELPYKLASPVLNDLQAQLNAADQAAAEAAKPPPSPPAEQPGATPPKAATPPG